MKIYIVHGYGSNPSECCFDTYAIVCTSREDAEKQLGMIIEEQVMFAKADVSTGIDFTEEISKVNGKLTHHLIRQLFDVNKPEQREALLWSTPVVGGNIKPDEYHPVTDDPTRPEYKYLTLASVGIREQEIKEPNGKQ